MGTGRTSQSSPGGGSSLQSVAAVPVTVVHVEEEGRRGDGGLCSSASAIRCSRSIARRSRRTPGGPRDRVGGTSVARKPAYRRYRCIRDMHGDQVYTVPFTHGQYHVPAAISSLFASTARAISARHAFVPNKPVAAVSTTVASDTYIRRVVLDVGACGRFGPRGFRNLNSAIAHLLSLKIM
eukprot:COSAG02_NODE_6163_length_3756_cov_8.168718_4_plen_181_part_00